MLPDTLKMAPYTLGAPNAPDAYTPSGPWVPTASASCPRHPWHPLMPQTAPTPFRSPQCPWCPYTPSGPWVPRFSASPQYTPDTPYTPDAKNSPYTPRTPNAPWCPFTLLVPEYLESLPAPQYTLYTPDPWHPKMAPTPPISPQFPWCSLYLFWPMSTYSPCQSPQYTPDTLYIPVTPIMAPYTTSFLLSSCSIVALQLTMFMQLKCSFSIVIFNCHHFATDHLHTVKMLIFYHHHLQLSSLWNWPSSGVCPVYNIPSLGVKGTSSVLWSSANFCSISQNTERLTKWSGHGKLLLMKDLLPERVTI